MLNYGIKTVFQYDRLLKLSEVKYLAQSFRSRTTENMIVDCFGVTGFHAAMNVGLAVKIKALNPLDAEILTNIHFYCGQYKFKMAALLIRLGYCTWYE